jgi:hypothetical protein
MEAVIIGSMLGMGYLLNEASKNDRNKNDDTTTTFKDPNDKSIYESNHYDDSKRMEDDLVIDKFNKAKDAINTNIIPPQFNNDIFNTQHTSVKYLQNSLTGEHKNPNEFVHNNMLPFFGSHVRQVTDSKSNRAILENHTGIEYFSNKKTEPLPMFEPTQNVNAVYGTENVNETIYQRIQPSIRRQNELPFEQERVGPGLNQGFNTTPAGGFHQDPREYTLPKNIDQLRPLSRPQITYAGRVVSGKNTNDKRTQIGKVEKNRPDRFYIQDEDRYLTTTGAYLRETKRPFIIAKDTNRKYTKEYAGSAATTAAKGDRQRELYKISSRQNFTTDGPRNAYQEGSWGNVNFGNFGKTGLSVFTNERDITGQRTHVTNLVTLVKATVAPLLDVFRTTRKENFEANPNEQGFVGVGHISKNAVWDSNNIARTTIKETTIDNEHEGFLTGPTRQNIYDPNDVMKTTTKETTLFSREGNVGNNGQLGYITNEQEAPNTNRQFSGDYEYEGGAHHTTFKEHMVYDTDYNMRQNIAREGTLIGRAPTDESVKLWNGVDTMNVDIKKLDSDAVNLREMSTDKVYNSVPQVIPCSYTAQKNNYEDKDGELMNNRIEPGMLDAFRSNPYTQPLNSYAWN